MTFDSSYYYIYFYLKEKSKIKIWKLQELKQYIGDLLKPASFLNVIYA